MNSLTIAGVWVLLGSLIAFLMDRSEMKKPIPYGEMPAVPLIWIRTGALVLGTLLLPVLLVATVFRLMWEGFPLIFHVVCVYARLLYAKRRLRKRLRKIMNKIVDKEIEERFPSPWKDDDSDV